MIDRIRVLPVCFSDKHFVSSIPGNQIIFLRIEKEKCSKF